MLQSRHINKVVFSSDGKKLINNALNAGAEVPFIRPYKYATDTASTWDVVRHCVSYLRKTYIPDIIVLLQPTTPFRTNSIIDRCIDNVIFNKLNACISVTEVSYPPQWMYKKTKIFLVSYFDKKRPSRRQDAEIVYKPNGMVYAFKLECKR